LKVLRETFLPIKNLEGLATLYGLAQNFSSHKKLWRETFLGNYITRIFANPLVTNLGEFKSPNNSKLVSISEKSSL
jgi:hypothetical protein